MDNVPKVNNSINIPSSQTLDLMNRMIQWLVENCSKYHNFHLLIDIIPKYLDLKWWSINFVVFITVKIIQFEFYVHCPGVSVQ
jgi:hypothetical protein